MNRCQSRVHTSDSYKIFILHLISTAVPIEEIILVKYYICRESYSSTRRDLYCPFPTTGDISVVFSFNSIFPTMGQLKFHMHTAHMCILTTFYFLFLFLLPLDRERKRVAFVSSTRAVLSLSLSLSFSYLAIQGVCSTTHISYIYLDYSRHGAVTRPFLFFSILCVTCASAIRVCITEKVKKLQLQLQTYPSFVRNRIRTEGRSAQLLITKKIYLSIFFTAAAGGHPQSVCTQFNQESRARRFFHRAG